MAERCPMCPNQCLKTELKCGRGKQYFNGENHQQSSFEQTNDLTGQLIKTSQILNHKIEMKKERERILDIINQKEYISQKELLDELKINELSLIKFLSRFEKIGLIEKDNNECLSLTSRGKEEIINRKSNDEDLFDMLEEQERNELKQLLERVLKSWHDQHKKFHQ